MININNTYHDYYCQLSCDYNKLNRCQLGCIQFEEGYSGRSDYKICQNQDLTKINAKGEE
jgi:hypothetical protein